MKNRTTVLTVAVMGVVGLALGWWEFGAPNGSHSGHEHTVLKPTPDLAEARHEFRLLPADIHADRETPALAADAEGRVVLAWASQTGEDERTLFLARSIDGGATFEAPVPWRKVPIYRFTSPGKGKGKSMVFSTHVLPRLAEGRDGIDLGWVEAIDGGPTVVYYVARSRDGGRTFSEPVRVHGDAVWPGFTTLSADPEGNISAAWLDGRNRAQQPFAAVRPAGSEAFEPERLVYAGPEDKGVCPCCDLAALRMPDGRQIIAFRNNDAGHRDIWLTRSPAHGAPGFEPPVPVTPDPWTFDGCPHDGPALALGRDRLHVLWMDAHTGKGCIYAASSPLSSWSFAPRPVSPDATGAQGHPKLAVAGGTLFAVWDEALDDAAPAADSKSAGDGGDGSGARPAISPGNARISNRTPDGHDHSPSLEEGGRAVMLAVSIDDGARFHPARPVAPLPGAFQLNPALAVAADGSVLVAWNELDAEGKRVVFARLKSLDDILSSDQGGR
jgi:hypothetical protein